MIALLVLAIGALAVAGPAAAAKQKNCARAVIDDWFPDNRVDKIYPRHCYRDAIKALPVDVRGYSNAEEDILRALTYAKQGKPDPGDKGSGSGSASGSGGSGPGSNGGGGTSAAGSSGVDTSGPSSVPIPLLVLAGLATLLLGLGAAGYLTRRMAARRNGDDEPPATV